MQLEAFLKVVENKGISYKRNVPMSLHTSFKIGGDADVFITVSNEEELKHITIAAKENGVPLFCIGKGSNLLVSDKGIEGAVVSLLGINSIEINGEYVSCGAGASLASLCTAVRDASLSGLEFAYGIPGSVGGAIFMNAGAYGGEMSQVAVSARCMDENGVFFEMPLEDMCLGYRSSAFKKNGFIVTKLTLKLAFGDKSLINAKMEELIGRRRDKQPLEYPSAGSTFKRPQGYFAGALIEKNKLKGVSIGGAQVSEKHAGFVINKGGATSNDVLALIQKIKQIVFEADGVELEPEVLFIGRK
ncbi:MAG: UDP-N-acetylmuramate dehydrogenase [Ruminococcaceae bacterium]|nr:UDP-N-acetylmuramate dehydrogenase [Oscillospiraceae bacterium]